MDFLGPHQRLNHKVHLRNGGSQKASIIQITKLDLLQESFHLHGHKKQGTRLNETTNANTLISKLQAISLLHKAWPLLQTFDPSLPES